MSAHQQSGPEEKPIGWLNNPNVYCQECRQEGEGVPLWKINVFPYSQTCHRCSKTLVEGNPGWVELYDNKFTPKHTEHFDQGLADKLADEMAEEDSAVMEESDEG